MVFIIHGNIQSLNISNSPQSSLEKARVLLFSNCTRLLLFYIHRYIIVKYEIENNLFQTFCVFAVNLNIHFISPLEAGP